RCRRTTGRQALSGTFGCDLTEQIWPIRRRCAAMQREISSVGVVGGGFMGAGIAEVSAVAGMPVVVRDLPQFLDAARGRVERSLAGAVKRGKIDQAKRDEVLARITFTP